MTKPANPAPAPAPQPAPTPAPTPQPTPAPPAPAPQPAPTPAPTPQPTPAPLAPAPQPPTDPARSIDHLPAWVQQEIRQARDGEARHRIAARTERVNNSVLLQAGQLGVNPAALLGSTAWSRRAEQLDPSAADYQAQLAAAVQAVLVEAPWTAAQPAQSAPQPTPAPAPAPAPPTSGGEFPGGNGAGQPITEAQLRQMTPEQIAEAFEQGKLKHLL